MSEQMWAIYCEADNTLCWNRARGWVGEGDTFDMFYDHERRDFTLPPGGAWRIWA